jgi:hypothetical protein
MTDDEKQRLQVAITTIADPRGNWDYGWKMLCELADVDPNEMPPHFKTPEITQLPSEDLHDKNVASMTYQAPERTSDSG